MSQVGGSTSSSNERDHGGMSDIRAGLQQQHLPTSALTQPTNIARKNGASALHLITGENRYSAPQQTSKGAVDAGAVAIRAPSSVGGVQIDVLPAMPVLTT